MAKRGKIKPSGLRPGFEGKREVVPSEVENPYDKGKFETVVRNIRESSLATMYARKQIDEAQLRAGEWIRAKIEKTRMSSGAIDPSYEPVDTSGHADPIPDRVIMASRAVADIRTHLGEVAWPVIHLVCGEGATVAEAAHRRFGLATEAQQKFVGQLLRASLDEAAVYLGYAQKRSKVQYVVDKRSA